MRPLARLLAVALLAVAPSLGTPAAAAPRTAAAAPAAGPATFGIQPGSPTGPDTRAQFQFGATKGAVVKDQIVVSNYGTTPLTLNVYASDAFNTAEGGFDLLAAARQPVDVGAWVKLSANAVTIPARGRTVLPFTLTLPSNVTPGDHVGGIVASLTTTQTDASGNKVAVEQRVGVRIYLRVAGLLRATLSVDYLHGEFQPAGATRGGVAVLTYTVRNTGNVRLTGHQQLSVGSPLWTDITVPSLPDLPELLPGATLQRTVAVADAPPVGWLDATLRVDPQAVGTDLNPPTVSVVRHTTFWAFTWLTWVALGVVLLLLGCGGLAIFFAVRRRRRESEQKTGGKARATVAA
ncbi:WxL protein peptidoglycan domain-containing protein [Catellatospora tritici]|uniref:WxL protein peptidoglycan domain-containing protein n=1 Tax=Catellatospora tritici TaxID=2851566 RepID=UPI001C2D77FE|nr:DUF916 domain-containing protein [Catellatospora tritici]MBV1855254.1 DUF916 domain-containing protein [Catellatospora tritici]